MTAGDEKFLSGALEGLSSDVKEMHCHVSLGLPVVDYVRYVKKSRTVSCLIITDGQVSNVKYCSINQPSSHFRWELGRTGTTKYTQVR
jgi:hypothetical protein